MFGNIKVILQRGGQLFPKRQILDLSNLKEFADDNFKFDENGRKFSERVQNTEKKRNCSLRAISTFLTMFSKDLYCSQVKGKGELIPHNRDF